MKDTDRGQHQRLLLQRQGQNHGDPHCRASLRLEADSSSNFNLQDVQWKLQWTATKHSLLVFLKPGNKDARHPGEW